MATVANRSGFNERGPDVLSGTPRAHSIDRWIFVFMAAWFIAITLTGFIPDSLMKIEMVKAGLRPPFPWILHAHAVLMGSFLVLLLAQTWLMATGRCAQHLRLGLARRWCLRRLLVVVGFILAPTMYYETWERASVAAPPEAQATLQEAALGNQGKHPDLLQMRIGILFPLFLAIGLRARGRNAGIHKRMMFLATVMALPAGIDRIPWLVPHHAGQPAVGRPLHLAGGRADVPVGCAPQPLDPPGLCHLAGDQHPRSRSRSTACGTPPGGTTGRRGSWV